MSERTPKQPLNDPEYTVPEYSVLLPSDEAKNSTAEGDSAPNNTASNNTASTNAAPSGAVDNNAAEDNAPGDSTPEHATTGYRDVTADYTATVSAEQVIPERPKAMRNVMWCAAAIIVLGPLSNFLPILSRSYIDFEMVVSVLFSALWLPSSSLLSRFLFSGRSGMAASGRAFLPSSTALSRLLAVCLFLRIISRG